MNMDDILLVWKSREHNRNEVRAFLRLKDRSKFFSIIDKIRIRLFGHKKSIIEQKTISKFAIDNGFGSRTMMLREACSSVNQKFSLEDEGEIRLSEVFKKEELRRDGNMGFREE